jgi:hypothetical protein
VVEGQLTSQTDERGIAVLISLAGPMKGEQPSRFIGREDWDDPAVILARSGRTSSTQQQTQGQRQGER